MDHLGWFFNTHTIRKKMRSGSWNHVLTYTIDGPLFERFLLKTLINLVAAKDAGNPWFDGSAFDSPPIDLVEAAFGRKGLASPCGLYVAAGTGETIEESEYVGLTCITIVDGADHIVAGRFWFRGFPFLIWIQPDLPPQKALPNGLPMAVSFRPARLHFGLAGTPCHELLFKGF